MTVSITNQASHDDALVDLLGHEIALNAERATSSIIYTYRALSRPSSCSTHCATVLNPVVFPSIGSNLEQNTLRSWWCRFFLPTSRFWRFVPWVFKSGLLLKIRGKRFYVKRKSVDILDYTYLRCRCTSLKKCSMCLDTDSLKMKL